MHPILRWSLRLLGPLLLIFFLATSDLQLLWDVLRRAQIWPIILSLLLLPPFLIIKSWRWVRLLREMGLDLPLPTACALYMVGIFYGATTPGQAGDLLKAVYLRDRGQPMAPAILSCVIDRLFDLLVMAAFAVVGIFALGRLLPSRELQNVVVAIMAIGVITITTLLVARGPREWALTVAVPRVAPRLRLTLDRWNTQLVGLSLSPRLLIELTIASLISASFTFLRLWLLFLALELNAVPLYVVVGVSALVAVLQVLPISIGGIGVRELVLIPVLASYGYSQEEAITLSALFLLINIQHIVVGFIVSLWFPLGRRDPQALSEAGEAPPTP